MFDDIFDFNSNGEADVFEAAAGLRIVFKYSDDDLLDAEEGSDLTGEAKREFLEDVLDELESKLYDLEDEEPDDCTCAAYVLWEARKDQLEDQISELEDQIYELEDQAEI